VQDFQKLLANNKEKLGIDHLNLTGIPAPQQQEKSSASARGSFAQYARFTAFSIYR
jgi:hypothetical protein